MKNRTIWGHRFDSAALDHLQPHDRPWPFEGVCRPSTMRGLRTPPNHLSVITGLVVVFLVVTSCGGPELPLGWSDAREIALEQSSCSASEPSSPIDHAVLAFLRDARLHVETTVRARCSQELCAYRQRRGETEQFLLQPCEMHPDQVAKCDCPYRLTMSTKNERAEQDVELYQRSDAYAGDPGPALLFFTGTALPE